MFVVFARVVAGALWLNEGITKFRAGFGSADIRLVADTVDSGSRTPDIVQNLLGPALAAAPGFFGVLVPVLETGLGAALILGVFVLPAACVSIGTLMAYWCADQLIGQYPLIVLLSTMLVLAPTAATRFSLVRTTKEPRSQPLKSL